MLAAIPPTPLPCFALNIPLLSNQPPLVIRIWSFLPMDFRVNLDTFRGPLDLLLYLVRKHEVDVAEIPIAKITEQYLDFLELLEQMNVNDVGDFLEVASTLVEIKSRMVLPHGGEEPAEWEDP